MNVVDIALLALGSYFVIRGLFRGLSGECFSLISIVGGFYCSLTFYTPLAGFLTAHLGVTHLASSAFSMLAIFLTIYAACALLQKGLRTILRGTSLTWLDKTLGAFAGFAKIYLIALVLLVAGMVASPVAGDAWVQDSKALIAAAKTWPYVYPLLDRIGILPDLAELQREAQDYILEQASRSLFESYGETSPTSADIQANPGALETVRSQETRNHPLLGIFLGLGKNR